MYKREYIAISEAYKKVYENMLSPVVPKAPDVPVSPKEAGTLAPTVQPDNIQAAVAITDEPALDMGSDLAPDMGCEIEQLISQIESKLQCANNLTKQEIDIVVNTLRKAKFDK